MDYAVGNVGLNTKYHASADHPVLIFYGDLEGRGRPNIVEAEYEGSICYPVRGRSCSSQAMPGLREKFPTFKKFASAALTEIYEENRLAAAQKLSATTLESGLLINMTEPGGKPRFEFRPLPRLAQISPVFGLAFAEVDGDGLPDLYLAQNSFAPQRETGRYNGGVSLLLLNGPDGFKPVPARESGLVVPGDAAALTVTDLDGDGLPEFHIGINDARPAAFRQDRARHEKPESINAIQLRGKGGNPDAAGAIVHVIAKGGKVQVQQVSAGGGYLSQSSPRLFFADIAGAESIEITWPSGKKSTHKPSKLEPRGGRVWISEPD